MYTILVTESRSLGSGYENELFHNLSLRKARQQSRYEGDMAVLVDRRSSGICAVSGFWGARARRDEHVESKLFRL